MENKNLQKPIKTCPIKRHFSKFNKKEIFWYIFGLLMLLLGISLLITYVVGENINVPPSKNPVMIFDDNIKKFTRASFGILGYGIVFTNLGALIVAIVLSVVTHSEEREKERLLRKKQRLQHLMSNQSTDSTVDRGK
ncbi:MAG: hypothetical protein ACTTID_00500 [Bacillales bacterium]